MNRTLWGAPAWAWLTGVAVGILVSLLLFDNPIVAVLFGFSIGAVFAIGFSGATRRRVDPPER